MRIAVNAHLCSGQGRCYTLSPDLFEADDEGYCAQRGTEFVVPVGKEAEARAGVNGCPEGAIKLLDG